MVENDYFAHQREGGPDLTERLDRVGWNGKAWGENIAYGCGSSSSPKATLRNWLNSPPHRDLLLSGTYRRAGLGVGSEAPAVTAVRSGCWTSAKSRRELQLRH